MMKKYDVIGVGNAIVDCLAYVDEAFLTQQSMERGSMQLISAQAEQDLRAQLIAPKLCSGGSVANTIAALASLGVRTAFLGRVAADAVGESFTADIRAAGVHFAPIPATKGKPTACCIICVTPDGERTMNTFIGASSEFTVADVDAEMIAESKILYLEGYLWDAEPAKEAILQAIHIAKDNGVKIAFSASDTFCVERHRAEFMHLINEHIDVLFANEHEAKALLQLEDAQQVAKILGDKVDFVAITRSSDSAIIAHNGVIAHVSPTSGIKPVDATGAGDLFAAGFLCGLLQGLNAEGCAHMGHRLAGHIIQQLGARSSTPLPSLAT